MKRLIALLLTISCLLCLMGCGALGSKDYNAKDKTFEFDKLKITLTDAFEVEQLDADSVIYRSSNDNSISIDKYLLSETDKAQGLSANALAEETRENLDYKKVSAVRTDNGLVYLECEAKAYIFDFYYLLSFYESDGALWVISFACELDERDIYKDHFIKWAQSVVLP